jgi:type III restriction enzyme
LKKDEWKENFIMQLREEHYLEQLWKGKNYIIWGMPFYNEALKKTEFENKLEEITNE